MSKLLKNIMTDEAPSAIGPYSQAFVVQGNHSIAYQKETNTQKEKLLKDFGDVQLKKSDTAEFKDNLSVFANIDLAEIIISGLIGSLFGGAITLWLTN